MQVEELEKAKIRLKKYKQDHLIPLISQLTDAEQEKIARQINGLDFDMISHLYQQLSNKQPTNSDEIEEIKAVNKDKLTEEQLIHYKSLGENIIKSGEYAFVTMSGGQGTRLGYDGPKGTFQVDIEPRPKFLFEILADNLKVSNRRYNITIPWYIMTSEENHDAIVDFFEKQEYFHYPKEYVSFFKQGKLPLMTETGKLIIGNNKLIKEAADGNGGIFSSMKEHGILEDMKSRNIKWIFIGAIDNILLQLADITLLGLAEDSNVEIATKSILKNSPDEKVGAICKQNGKVKVIEYSEMSDEMKNKTNEDGELTFGESHVMCNLFSLKALELLADKQLPYHIAHKKSDYLNNEGMLIKVERPNVYKFETFIFDAWMYFDDIAILRGKREEDFAPIKNREGVDSPETAIVLYNNYREIIKRRKI